MDADRAYVDGLKLLARRELSEQQVRRRLARKGHDEGAIDAAVARLRAERAIDDARVAAAIARTQTILKRRGKARVQLEIERAGISRALAKRAVDVTLASTDERATLDASLARRLPNGARVADDREFQRLYRYLVAQGFEPEHVVDALERRRR